MHMYTVTGSFKDGVATPDEPVEGYEGQPVLITFLGDEQPGEDGPTPEEVMARIAAKGPKEGIYIPPKESLAEALARPRTSDEPPIDPVEWDRQWAEIEAEMNRRDLEDDRAEGHA
jgi:hypothetical protein